MDAPGSSPRAGLCRRADGHRASASDVAVTLFVDGVAVGSGRVERTCAFVFSLDETCAVGSDSGAPVCDDYPAGTANAFGGTIRFLQIDVGSDSHEHLIDPEIRAHLAMTRQ